MGFDFCGLTTLVVIVGHRTLYRVIRMRIPSEWFDAASLLSIVINERFFVASIP